MRELSNLGALRCCEGSAEKEPDDAGVLGKFYAGLTDVFY